LSYSTPKCAKTKRIDGLHPYSPTERGPTLKGPALREARASGESSRITPGAFSANATLGACASAETCKASGVISRRNFISGALGLAAATLLPLRARSEGAVETAIGIGWGKDDHAAAVMLELGFDGVTTVRPISHEDLYLRGVPVFADQPITAFECREAEEQMALTMRDALLSGLQSPSRPWFRLVDEA